MAKKRKGNQTRKKTYNKTKTVTKPIEQVSLEVIDLDTTDIVTDEDATLQSNNDDVQVALDKVTIESDNEVFDKSNNSDTTESTDNLEFELSDIKVDNTIESVVNVEEQIEKSELEKTDEDFTAPVLDDDDLEEITFTSLESSNVSINNKKTFKLNLVKLKDFNIIQKIKSYNIKKEDIKKIPTNIGHFIKVELKRLFSKIKQVKLKDIVSYLKTHINSQRVMHALTLCSVFVLGGLALYSYLFSFPKALEPKPEPENKQVVSQNYYVDIDVNTVETPTVLWNATFRDAIDNQIKADNYISLQQVTSSVNQKGNQANVTLTTNIAVDFTTQRLHCITDMTDNIGNKHSEYFYDNIDKLYITNLEDDGWVKSNKLAVNVNFSLEDYENCADFYKFLLNDFGVKNNTEGKVIEDHVYFDYTRPALERDLTNINYDKLDDTTIQLVFKKISDTKMQPLSMIKQVDFEVNDNIYSSKLVILFDEMARKELEIPEYKDYLEEDYETMSENKVNEGEQN